MGTQEWPATFSTDGDGTVIARGEIDLSTAPKLWEAIAPLIEQEHRKIVVDLAGVDFIDSTGISVLIRAYKKLQSKGGILILRSPQSQPGKLFDLTRLTEIFEIEGEQD